MFELCLFDLDDTLIRTTDLQEIREACKNNNNANQLAALERSLDQGSYRHIFDVRTLKKIRSNFPEIKLGVFTRSPRSYALATLDWAYPDFEWDIVIAYEDVKPTKPSGKGIHKAMEAFDIEYLDNVVLVGDTDVDIRSSYNAGCWVALSKAGWPRKRLYGHWAALEHVPDFIIDSPEEILEVLRNPFKFLPELEFLITKDQSLANLRRFDKINHFVAKAAGKETTAYPIYVCGRSFSNYASVAGRKRWHKLTASIEKNKNSDTFPESWIKAIRHFIEEEHPFLFSTERIVVTVIPHRPGRKARLENLLGQLERSINTDPINGCIVSCQPQLLAYRPEVKSQHNDHLNRDQRFINVRDNLYVNERTTVKKNISYIVIDDVTTTGASLIYAYKYLMAAGASKVKCLSMAKNIGDI